MLNNEQCIAVAEEIWGYRHVKDGAGKDWGLEPQPYLVKVWKNGYDEIMMPELRDKVNSWQGFGRTVEAMAERGIHLCGHEIGLAFVDDEIFQSFQWDQQLDNPTSLIEATHLAALEVVRKEKEDAEGS